MGMLQKYRNKMKQGERRELEKRIESGDAKVMKIKVRVPSAGSRQNSMKKGKK